MILPAGVAKYRFVLYDMLSIQPNANLLKIKLPDATPGIIAKNALNDEQALLAILRYNRLVDIFTQVTCYSLQNHLRTTAPDMGQVETDEVYIGLDKTGTQYVFPIQAKGGNDKLSVVQIIQDAAMCANKFVNLICRPIGAQFTTDNAICLFEFTETRDGYKICAEKHYMLVQPDEISNQELSVYQKLIDRS